MIVELGNKGLENSWQAPFPESVDCVHCKGIALPVVCLMEEGKTGPEGDFICNLPHPGTSRGKHASYWPHDAAAFAVYLCLKCLEPTALFNQA